MGDEDSRYASELDALHAEAKAAFERKDLATYTSVFAPGLRYRQRDGRVIGRDQLMRDVQAQFRRFNRVHSSYVREHLEVTDGRATEILEGTGSAEATAFFVVHFTWKVTRRGRYLWTRMEGRWQIEEVDVWEEKVSRGSFRFGLKARPCSGGPGG